MFSRHSIALACVLAVAGCGTDKDPAKVGAPGGDGDTTNHGDGDGDGDKTGGDGDKTGGDGDKTGGDGDKTGGDGDKTGGDGDKAGTDGGTPTTDAGMKVCEENHKFVGQEFEKADTPANGGMETLTPYPADYDSGIAALIAAAPTGKDPATVNLKLTDATVIATGFDKTANKHFWLQDGKAAIVVYMAAPIMNGTDAVSVVVGSKISATVTTLGSYGGVAQITGGTDWKVSSLANPVYIDDRSGKSITVDDANHNIRVTGTLEGTPTACGGTSQCWDFNYNGTTKVTFRSASKFLMTGACVTFVGPVSRFDTTVQLDTTNFDWIWTQK